MTTTHGADLSGLCQAAAPEPVFRRLRVMAAAMSAYSIVRMSRAWTARALPMVSSSLRDLRASDISLERRSADKKRRELY